MKNRIRNLVIVLLASVFLFGCSKEVRIKNVASSETLTLKSNEKNPTRMWLALEGRIEGEAMISLMLEGKPYRSEKLNGDVNLVWENDWYSNEAIIKYDHGNAKSGHLVIRYEF